MLIIPAIDLKDGKCVRLRQGDMANVTVFNEDPASQALQWQRLGASIIHVVDLDGSVAGRPRNLARLAEIADAVEIPVQVGGGIRNEETAHQYLETGIDIVVLGTLAVRQPEVARNLSAAHPGRIAIGIDARAGRVAVEGWTEATTLAASELAESLEAASPKWFIYTDIEKDGMMSGPNLDATRRFAAQTRIPVILSGGVSTMADVEQALALEEAGVCGMIIGRALYEKRIELPAAIAMAGRPRSDGQDLPA